MRTNGNYNEDREVQDDMVFPINIDDYYIEEEIIAVVKAAYMILEEFEVTKFSGNNWFNSPDPYMDHRTGDLTSFHVSPQGFS